MESPLRKPHPSPTRKAYVETYGCQMNVSDGELMQGILGAGGFELVRTPEEADVILVNTCAIREHAEQRVLGRVGQLNARKLERPDVVIGVTGCMAQRMGETLLEQAPYVDLVLGPDAYRALPAAVARVRPEWGLAGEGVAGGEAAGAGAGAEPSSTRPGRRTLPVLGATDAGSLAGQGEGKAAAPSGRLGTRLRPELAAATASVSLMGRRGERLALLDLQPHEDYENLEVRRSEGVSAWVPVQRGCDHRCTYCIVPYVRGAEKNREPERILAEVRSIARSGVPEVVLLGQTVNSYRHGAWDFPALLRAVARVEGIRRVRFTSPHPADVTPELVAVMAEEPAVCAQLHLPAQAGHDRTLKRMLRRYTVEEFLEKVALVRAAVPGIALSTDIIVAFPGETEAEYEATLDLMRGVRFDDAYLYRYSPRDGTPATRLPADSFVPAEVGQARLERLIGLQREIQAEINRAEVGRLEEVLVERPARSEGDMLGRTERNKMVVFPGGAELAGRFVRVRLTGTTGATFLGQRVEGDAATRVA
ncbi:MAG TPA: MiaB/RimO family radical SAM methylthiotransferase [Longimicrobiales bacterium]|nr:MiaB/RimO family radical SAM methylthiotransferase [Longimicrobiales bacterium]